MEVIKMKERGSLYIISSSTRSMERSNEQGNVFLAEL